MVEKVTFKIKQKKEKEMQSGKGMFQNVVCQKLEKKIAEIEKLQKSTSWLNFSEKFRLTEEKINLEKLLADKRSQNPDQIGEAR